MITTLLQYFATFAAFVAGVAFVTEFINDLFKVPSKPDAKFASPKQIVAWVVAILGACLGFYMQVGFLAEYGPVDQWTGWVMTVITGFFAGLASNGTYDINLIQNILKFIFQFLQPKTKVINE